MAELLKKDIIYPELSYKIVGALFSVFNTLGYGYQEKYYQRAVAAELTACGLAFQEQIAFPILFKEKVIGRQILDFLVDRKIIIELKRGNRFSRHDILQVMSYLRAANLQLAILARFHGKGLIFKRVVNIT